MTDRDPPASHPATRSTPEAVRACFTKLDTGSEMPIRHAGKIAAEQCHHDLAACENSHFYTDPAPSDSLFQTRIF
jgi:hypothetical protein